MSTYTIMVDGVALPITDTNAVIKIQLFTTDGLTALTEPRQVGSSDPGANWAAGVIGVTFTAPELAALAPPDAMLVISGPTFVKRFRLVVQAPNLVDRSSLFVKDYVIDELRSNQLMMLAQNVFDGVTLTDEFLWDKIKVAESTIAHALRVPLVPTQFYSNPPSAADLALLPAGMPWDIDPAYDYLPDFFQGEKWGFIVTRQIPIIAIQQIQFVYPAPTTGFFVIPGDWIRFDRKFGHIRLIPASSTFVAPLNAFLLQALGGGRSIPFAIEIKYQAGLPNARKDYPELLDAIKKTAILRIIEDGFFPSSGSISADGLSQSMSLDMDKYRGTIDNILNGPKGSNGGLMTAIHGVRTSVLGAM